MKIIIDIPEEFYKHSCETGFLCWEWMTMLELTNAIKNGTPLPKGHEDLIDRSEVIKSLFDYYNGKKTIGQCIEDTPTFIEADKEV